MKGLRPTERRDRVLGRMLRTPPTPHKPVGKRRGAPAKEPPSDEELKEIGKAIGNAPEEWPRKGD